VQAARLLFLQASRLHHVGESRFGAAGPVESS